MTRLWCCLGTAALAVALAGVRPALADDPGKGAQASASKSEPQKEKDPFKKMKVSQVAKKVGKAGVHIYDGNSLETYTKKGHVPGAVNLHSGDIKEGVLPAEKDATLIFYCMNEL